MDGAARNQLVNKIRSKGPENAGTVKLFIAASARVQMLRIEYLSPEDNNDNKVLVPTYQVLHKIN